MFNDTLPHHNDNTSLAMEQTRKQIVSRPPSMSKHFATDTQMQSAKHPYLIEFEAAIEKAFAPLLPSIERDRDFHLGGHAHD